MKNAFKILLVLILSLTILLTGTLAIKYLLFNLNSRNPFKEVAWITEYPGATGRYVEYTPVLKSDTSIVLGPTIGADYAKLRFKDIDKDGKKEVIIETKILFDWGEYRYPEKHILKYKKDNKDKHPKFSLINSKSFIEKVPDIYK